MAGYIGNQAQIRSGLSATIDELNIIDGVTATTAELNILDGVTSTATELNILDGVTATTAELNIMDGVTATTAELNIMDGVTATTAELNIMDGVTATAAEINLIDGGTARGTTAIADGDGVLINDAGTMRMTSVETMATYIGTKVGGGLEFISSTDISDAATVSFTGFDASKYDNYVFYIQNVTITGNGGVDFGLRTSSNGGSSYDSGSSDYKWVAKGQRADTDEDTYDVSDPDIRLTFSQGGDTGEEGGASGTVHIFGPHLTTKTRVSSNLGFFHSGSEGSPSMQIVNGVRDSEADVDAVQFFMSSGNIASGTITMYGLVNS